jgi:hypothetical protein
MKSKPFKLTEYGPAEYALQGLFFRSAFEVEPRCFSTLLDILPDCPANAVFGESSIITVAEKIKLWGESWHLTDAWCGDGALALLLVLSHFADIAVKHCDIRPTADTVPLSHGHFLMLDEAFAQMALIFGHPPFLANSISEPDTTIIPLEISRWDPTKTTWEIYEKYFLGECRKAACNYRYDVEAEATAQGFKKTIAKRNPEHCLWLARYQIKGERISDIWHSKLKNGKRRNKGEITYNAVDKAIRDSARAIGLTLRN